MDSLVGASRHGNGKQPKPFKPFRQQPGKGPGYNSMEPMWMGPNSEPLPCGIFSAARQKHLLPKPGKAKLKGISNNLSVKQTDPRPALPIQSTLASSRLKIDFLPIVKPVALAGRLVHFLSNWEQITVDQVILDTIRGYKLDFTSSPIQDPFSFRTRKQKKSTQKLLPFWKKERWMWSNRSPTSL